jgi:hypothetical protein
MLACQAARPLSEQAAAGCSAAAFLLAAQQRLPCWLPSSGCPVKPRQLTRIEAALPDEHVGDVGAHGIEVLGPVGCLPNQHKLQAGHVLLARSSKACPEWLHFRAV